MKFIVIPRRRTRMLHVSRQAAAVIAMLLALGTTATVGSAALLLSPAPAHAAVVSGDAATTAQSGGGSSAGGSSGDDIVSAAGRALTMARVLGASAIAIGLVIVCVWAAYTRKFTLATASLGFCVLAALMITDAGYNLVVNTANRLAG